MNVLYSYVDLRRAANCYLDRLESLYPSGELLKFI
jgi:hypothetical protein